MSQPAFDFGDEPVDDPTNPTFSVGELADAINAQLRRGFTDGVWVRGEIQGWSDRGSHAYFSLVEELDDGKAVLNVQFFANSRMRLRPLLRKHRLRLGDGMKVRIFGQLDYYAPTGRLGLKMSGIDPRFTLGELAMERDEIVRRLVASGVFDANRRRVLSPIPLRVGVVTSVGTAAWHDFRDELVRSGLGFHLVVADTRVQGDGAVAMVAASVRALARRAGRGELDVIVVIRGGGARNELATFDAEPIAMAIATSPVPVFTGLGHEVDRSVADEVAHTAWKTPTACAGGLVERARAYAERTEQTWASIAALAVRELRDADTGLADRAHRISRRTHAAVDRADDRLHARIERVRRCPDVVLGAAERHLDHAVARLRTRPLQAIAAEERHLSAVAARVDARDPQRLLAQGWSITCTDDGRAVRSVRDVAPGTALVTRVADGTIASTATTSTTSTTSTSTTSTGEPR